MECHDKSILVVDDEKAIRESISDFLEDTGCKPDTAANGREAVEMIRSKKYDAVIMDLNMPEMDGFEVLERIVPENTNLPIIVLSGVGIIDKAVEAIRKGAWDFLPKPISSFSVLDITLNRVFERARLRAENRLYREHLEDEVKRKTAQVIEMSRSLIAAQKEIILKLGDVVETRSHETGNHVQRVSEYTYLLAKLAGMTENEALDIKLASPMHDVGKIGIPDEILNKPGTLTVDEFDVIKTHTTIGHSIFNTSELPVLKLAAEIALCHHENWDGTGYPGGIKERSIPVNARITTIVDVFDAVSHPRIYKEAWEIKESYDYIKLNSGIIFDPELTELFLDNIALFLEIHHEFTD
jgi:putative two-component system response regulator